MGDDITMEQTARRTAAGERGRGDRPGFTLVELVIVLVIIGIMAAVGLPRISSRGMTADAGARMVRGTLEVAQRVAVARQFDVIVSFDAARNSIRIVEDQNNNATVDAGERTTWRALEGGAVFAASTTAIPGAPPGGGPVVVARNRTIAGLPSVIFRRNGAASSAAVVYLGGLSGEPTMIRGVTVEQATGRPEAFRLLQGTWRRSGQ